MPEWVVEAGIGEDRAALIEGDTILAARVCWREPWRAGAIAPARLDHRHRGTRRGAAQLPDGTIAQIDALPPDIADGASLMVRITRAALAERGRFKLAQCRPTDVAHARPAPSLAETLAATGLPVRVAGMLDRSLDTAGWNDLTEQAVSGVIDFPGGRLTISPTPAMTLIDIDGPPPLLPLSLAAVPAIAGALARLRCPRHPRRHHRPRSPRSHSPPCPRLSARCCGSTSLVRSGSIFRGKRRAPIVRRSMPRSIRPWRNRAGAANAPG